MNGPADRPVDTKADAKADASRSPAPAGFNPLRALVFPFVDRGRGVGAVPLPLYTLIPYFGLIPMRGWRLACVRESVQAGEPRVPALEGVGRHFVDGLLLWALRTVFFIPLTVIVAATAFGTFGILIDSVKLLLDELGLGWEGMEVTSAEDLAARITPRLLIRLLGPAVYVVLAWPIYRACIIRYAITGRAGDLFRIDKAIATVLRHAGDFAMVFAVWLVLRLVIQLPIAAVLTVSVFGAPLIPLVLMPMHYWATGYVYSVLALRVARGMGEPHSGQS